MDHLKHIWQTLADLKEEAYYLRHLGKAFSMTGNMHMAEEMNRVADNIFRGTKEIEATLSDQVSNALEEAKVSAANTLKTLLDTQL